MHHTSSRHIIGENLRLYRIKAGLSRERLSQNMKKYHQLRITPTLLKHYEQGRKELPAAILHSIAAITQTSMAEFFEDPHPAILLNTQTIRLIEAFSLIQHPGAKSSMLNLARQLAHD